MQTEVLIKENQGTIVDVRSPGEYSSGHVDGSKNIPLTEIPDRLEELKQLPAPLILCCASGMRSGQVERYLQAQNIECINGGSWLEINYLKFS
ncbi:rhodanese-like domain-containing protein [Christiangramia crocea]|uniref:Rhodanese-like domain-containing protein n=1 Tax=Christiangramia crocea TaxID=2904124 RepID=A0A9X1UXQ3_9FLAO|nr:rhodanese-like domain-containing protein [Gramella crocea]MCG9972156.1 rhodanese-like domain-containing protein [Gramella crocea]